MSSDKRTALDVIENRCETSFSTYTGPSHGEGPGSNPVVPTIKPMTYGT